MRATINPTPVSGVHAPVACQRAGALLCRGTYTRVVHERVTTRQHGVSGLRSGRMERPRRDDDPPHEPADRPGQLPSDDDDGVDWAEVGWEQREQDAQHAAALAAACCDQRDHAEEPCACTEHPQSYLHPYGTRPWPAP